MPIYRVLRKPHWTDAGPVEVGETVELTEEAAAAFPHNLARAEAAPDPLFPLAPAPDETPLAGLVDALGGELVNLLTQADFYTVEQMQAASDAELRAVPGIGRATLKKIREVTNGD